LKSNKMQTDKDVAISLTNIHKTYVLRESESDTIRHQIANIFRPNKRRKIKALQNVNLKVYKGEFLGVVGHNGSGKSSLLNIIMGAIPPDKGGKVVVNGKLLKLSLGMGFDHNLTARENIYLNGSMLGLSFKKIGEKFERIIEFSNLSQFVDTQVKFFSKGMKSRLAFAIALNAEADIFLFDEFFGGVGDLDFKKKSNYVFQKKFVGNKTGILVSHNLRQINKYCKKAILIERGKIIALGTPEEILDKYKAQVKKA